MDMLRESAKKIQQAGVRPEIEAFELGHIWQAKQLIKENLLDKKALFQLCMGIPYGAEGTTRNVVAMFDALPTGVVWGAFWNWKTRDADGRPISYHGGQRPGWSGR